MQNSNLTPEEKAKIALRKEAEQNAALQSGILKLFCNYAKHVASAQEHNEGADGIHPYLVIEDEEVNSLIHIYQEAADRRIFHYD